MATSQAQLLQGSRKVSTPSSKAVTRNAQSSSDFKAFAAALNNFKLDPNTLEFTSICEENDELLRQLSDSHERVKALEEEARRQEECHVQAFNHLSTLQSKANAKLESELDQKRQQVARLEEEVRGANTRKSSLEAQAKSKEAVIKQHEEALTAWTKKHTKKSEQCDAMEKNLKSMKGQVDILSKQVLEKQKALNGVIATNKEIGMEILETQKLLQSSQEELHNLLDLAAQLLNDDEMKTVKKLDEVWQSAWSIVKSHLLPDLNKTSLDDQDLWKRLKSPLHMEHTVPLPRSNTPDAKNMRCAVVLAYLFQEINYSVFQPSYALHEMSTVRRMLLKDAIRDTHEESHRRAMLLSLNPDDERDMQEVCAQRVLGNLRAFIRGLLLGDQLESFTLDIKGLLDNVFTMWREVRHYVRKYEPRMGYNGRDDNEWMAVQLEGGDGSGISQVQAKENATDKNALEMCPRLFVVEDHQLRAVSAGIALKEYQTKEAARQCREEAKALSSAVSQVQPSQPRGRKDSFTTNKVRPALK